MLFITFVLQNESLRQFKNTYRLFFLLFFLVGCKSTKFVPKDRYLLKKNTIEIIGGDIDEEEITPIIRQQPNGKLLGLKWDLFLYNRIDSVRIADKRNRKNIENNFQNQSRKSKQDKINLRRIQKAQKRGESSYEEKNIPLLDSLDQSLFFKEWLKYKVGEAPVIFDSLQYEKSIEQLSAYLKKKGYYQNHCYGSLKFKRNRKVKAHYFIEPGKRYVIDTVCFEVNNEEVRKGFEEFVLKSNNSLKGQPLDIDNLDEYRTKISRYMRDKAIYGFSPNSVKYLIDTNSRITVKLIINDRKVFSIQNKDSLELKKYQRTVVKNVFFHVLDSNYFNGHFKDTIENLGLILNGRYMPTIDTLYFNSIKNRHSQDVDSSRIAYFLYNGKLFLDPKLIEVQSLLEKNNEITETYTESTYNRLQQLGLFQTIKTEIIEIPETNKVDVHYYLTPSKKELFSSQFRVTTTNGFFGLSTGINYTNKNLFKGAEKLTFGLNGSLQTQPPIIDQQINTSDLKAVTTKFYQFEIGPTLKLELPGLIFFPRAKINKSRLAKTIFSGAYTFQKRDLYVKENIQLNSTWKYEIRNTQTVQMGIPGLSVIKFVSIIKSDAFDEFLKKKNNPFQTNTFSNQFIWQDWQVSFEYRDKNKASKKRKTSFYYLGAFDLAGNLISAFQKYQVKDSLGRFKVGGLAYAQFSRIDNTIIYTVPFGKTRSLNMRSLIGAGLSYGNSKTSLPYDYSFYAGGSNDVRGWKASALGPGSYKYYLDTNGTSIQIGDIRLAASIEYRYQYSKKWKGAVFLDGGNIWTMKTDLNRPGSKFSGNWFKEIALAPGIGLRRDFDYFVIRIDLGFPIHNPALPEGERWLFQKHTAFNNEVTQFLKDHTDMTLDALNKIDTTPFKPRFSFGIGYPF